MATLQDFTTMTDGEPVSWIDRHGALHNGFVDYSERDFVQFWAASTNETIRVARVRDLRRGHRDRPETPTVDPAQMSFMFGELLPFNVGVELTWIPSDIYVDVYNLRLSGWTGKLTEWAQGHMPCHPLPEVRIDGGAIEVTGPVFSDWETLEDFYRLNMRLAAEQHHSLEPNPDASRICSGGGHLHLSWLEKPEQNHIDRTFAWLAHDLARYPAVTWAMLDPSDTKIHSPYDAINSWQAALRNIWHDVDRDELVVSLRHYCSKRYVLNYSRFDTIEFRLFAAPRNWDEQRAHLNLAMAMLARADKRAKLAVQPTLTPEKMERMQNSWSKWTIETALANFRKYIDQLQLEDRDRHILLELAEENCSLRFSVGAGYQLV